MWREWRPGNARVVSSCEAFLLGTSVTGCSPLCSSSSRQQPPLEPLLPRQRRDTELQKKERHYLPFRLCRRPSKRRPVYQVSSNEAVAVRGHYRRYLSRYWCWNKVVWFVRDGKVRKSVERIFTIWEERSVYPEEVIAQFKAGINKKDKEKPKEKVKEATAAKGLFIFDLFLRINRVT